MNQRNVVKRLGVWLLITGGILMIPLIANFPWTVSDFVFGFILLFGSASAYEMLTRSMADGGRRARIGLAVLFVLLFLWVGGATGFEGVPSKIEAMKQWF